MSDENQTEKIKQPWSFELYLRKISKGVLDPIAGFFLKIGLKPNMVTGLGVILNIVTAYFLVIDKIQIAGLILLIGAPLDALDGAMARKRGEPSRYGAFIDSVSDRYAELILLGGLLIHYIDIGNMLACLLAFIAAAGSVLVSYTKARAESLDFNAKVGILTRVERSIVMIICLLINQPLIALWIIAILANFTAIQRIAFVHKQAFPRDHKTNL